jgi:methanogenic corrinoid protein MtbC1
MDAMPSEGLQLRAADHDCLADPRLAVRRAATAVPSFAAPPVHAGLLRTIETEIIPRLMLAHRNDGEFTASADAAAPIPIDVEGFTEVLLGRDPYAAEAYLEAMREGGASLEVLCMDLLGPSARLLGEYWETDRCDFTQVTLGLWRLQTLLRGLGPGFPSARVADPNGRRALMVSVPGEQHTFGLVIVTEFFRRAGWEVFAAPPTSLVELRSFAGAEWFDIAGISVSCDDRIEDVTASVAALRSASRNDALVVLVGGRPFVEHPEYVAVVGADGTASEGSMAPMQAATMVAARYAARHRKSPSSSA